MEEREGMKQHYVHCPHCGELDRHFSDFGFGEKTERWFCQKCLTYSLVSDYVQPEVTDEWIVRAVHGEISIVQKKDVHGRISHGWFSESKVLIADNTKHSPVHDQIIELARQEADRRNALLR